MKAKLEIARGPAPAVRPVRPASGNHVRSLSRGGGAQPAATRAPLRCTKPYRKALRAAEMAVWRELRPVQTGARTVGRPKLAPAFRTTSLARESATETAVMLCVFLFAGVVIVEHFLAGFGSGDLLGKLSELVRQ